MLHAGDGDLELDSDVEADCAFIGVFAERDGSIDRGFVGNLDLVAAGDGLDGAQEAGGIANGKQLLGIGARTVIAAHGLWRVEGDRETIVIGLGGAGTAAGGVGVRGVDGRLDHGTTSFGGEFDARYLACNSIVCNRYFHASVTRVSKR